MNANKVHKNIHRFATPEITFTEFYDMLLSSSRSNPVKVKWRTNGIPAPAHTRNYEMFWDSGAYVGGKAGGSATKALENMVNIQVIGIDGNWRTLDLNTVEAVVFENKRYLVV